MSNSSDHITRRVEAVAEIFKQANVEWTQVESFELRWEKINMAPVSSTFEDWQLVPIINIHNKK